MKTVWDILFSTMIIASSLRLSEEELVPEQETDLKRISEHGPKPRFNPLIRKYHCKDLALRIEIYSKLV
ncbi:CLUMA_CG005639, isoform A [Clunio marinus]|uniref:CLUMA_CG005639, isoform A n=1 Tax=Clunio marinus TaxID=568069 RepID=A0A1J1HVQ0_9DIPT|nr:CLUMA_CG005639, isoform A [Clunio marinus]